MILDDVRADLRLALRGLWRARGFSAIAILILAVGIGGSTVMFALVQGVLLRPLPVRDQEKIIVAWKTLPAAGFTHDPFGAVEIERVRSASQLLEQVAGVDANGVGPEVLDEGEAARYVNGAVVTGTFFEVLGVEPVLGRALTSADDIDGAEPVLVDQPRPVAATLRWLARRHRTTSRPR